MTDNLLENFIKQHEKKPYVYTSEYYCHVNYKNTMVKEMRLGTHKKL